MIQVWVFHSMNGIYTDKNENYFSENIHKKRAQRIRFVLICLQ